MKANNLSKDERDYEQQRKLSENNNAKLQTLEKESKTKAVQAGFLRNEFEKFRGKVPHDDRRIMAYNFNSLVCKYELSASKVDFSKDYEGEQSFNVDFSRCRLNELDNVNKRITGNIIIWKRFIKYLNRRICDVGSAVSSDGLLGRVLKGTTFLGRKEERSFAERIEDNVWSMADRVDEKYNLLPFYREVAKLQTDYFIENGTLLEKDINFSGVDLFKLTSNKIFDFTESLDFDLLNKSLSSLTEKEWDSVVVDDLKLNILGCLRDELFQYHSSQRDDVEDEDSVDEFDIERLNRSSLRSLIDYFFTQLEISGIYDKNFQLFQDEDWRLLKSCINEVFVFSGVSSCLDIFKFRISKYFELAEVDSTILYKVVNYSVNDYVFLKQFPHILMGMCDFAILDSSDKNNSTNEWSSQYAAELNSARELSRQDLPIENHMSLLYLVLIPDLTNNRMLPCFLADISDFGIDLFSLKDFLYPTKDSYFGTEVPEYRFFTDIGNKDLPSVRLFKDVFSESYDFIFNEIMISAEASLKQNPYIKRRLSILNDLEKMDRFFDSD